MNWTRHRGFYGWAPWRKRIPARYRLARHNGLDRPQSIWLVLRAEFREP